MYDRYDLRLSWCHRGYCNHHKLYFDQIMICKFLFLSSEYARALAKDKKFKEALSVISLCSQVIMVIGHIDNETPDDTKNDTLDDLLK